MRLKHPDSKHTVETDNPEPYLSQGWVEAKATKKAVPKPKPQDNES